MQLIGYKNKDVLENVIKVSKETQKKLAKEEK